MTDSIRYSIPNNTQVLVLPQGWFVPQPCETEHQLVIDEWLADGNSIEPYNAFAGMTLDEAYNYMGNEIITYANNLVDSAFSNPTQTITDIDPSAQRRKINKRRNNRVDKQAGEIALTQAEKDMAKTDQKLSEYEVKIDDDKDKAITNMMKLNTVEEVSNFDITAQTWTVWSPPV